MIQEYSAAPWDFVKAAEHEREVHIDSESPDAIDVPADPRDGDHYLCEICVGCVNGLGLWAARNGVEVR